MSRKAIIKRLEAVEADNEPLQLCFIHEPVMMDEATEVKYIGQNANGHHQWAVPWDSMDEFGRVVDEFNPENDKRFAGNNAINPLHIILAVSKPVREVKITRGE